MGHLIHTYKGAANHNRVVNEGRAATKIVALAAVLSLGGAGAADSKTSGFSNQQKMQQRVMTNRAADSREAMAREKHTAEPKRACDFTGQQAKRNERGEEPSEIENKNQEDSVLYQGRKNHDHSSSEGRKIKKYDSDGAKTPWHRNPQPLMVNLSKTEWQSRIPENVKSSAPDEQSASETEDKARSTESRSLNAKLKGVNGEFGEHLRKVEQRMHRAENWRAITAERAHRHSSAEKKKDLKFQINEDVELYRESKLDQQREQYFRTPGCEYVSENSTWYSKSETVFSNPKMSLKGA